MSIFSELQNAATEAQGLLAQGLGMAEGAAGNFIGPNGQTYTMIFRAADAFESQGAAREMVQHGYNDRSVVIATATRSQFAAVPLDWRRKKGTIVFPAAQDALISDVSERDPLFYIFVMLVRQA